MKRVHNQTNRTDRYAYYNDIHKNITEQLLLFWISKTNDFTQIKLGFKLQRMEILMGGRQTFEIWSYPGIITDQQPVQDIAGGVGGYSG